MEVVSGSGKTEANSDIVEFVRLKGNKYRQFPKKQSGVAGNRFIPRGYVPQENR